jgi:hypothetical protein
MAKRYVYRNVNKRPVNIGGYQFGKEQELESDVLINGFNEAVSNGFLELIERKPEGAEQDATQAPQTDNTGKVKVIFHMGVDAEGNEILEEVEIDPETSHEIEFPDINLKEGDTFAWFKDAEFTDPVDIEKAELPKEGDLHLYVKYTTAQKDEEFESSDESQNTGEVANSSQDQASLPSSGNESSPEGSEIKQS